MDPPEVHVTITASGGVPSGPASPASTIKTIMRAGPSPWPSGFIALAVRKGRRLPSILTRDLEQPRPRARRETQPGRAARAGDVPNSKRMRSDFPQRTARRGSWEQPSKRDLQQRTKSELRRRSRRNTVALSFIDGLTAADKSQRGKKKALTDLGRSIRDLSYEALGSVKTCVQRVAGYICSHRS